MKAHPNENAIYRHIDNSGIPVVHIAEIPTIATPAERWSEKGCLLSDCHFALRAIRTREAIAVTTTKSVGWKKPEGN